MEKPAATVANPHRNRLGFSNFRNEGFAPSTLGTGDSEKFPERDEIIAASPEIRTFEHVGIRHPFPLISNEGSHFVRYRESDGRERGRIFEFPACGIGMVDIPSARSEGCARMLVPIEKIERERECRNFGISTLGTLRRLHEKLAFTRRKIKTESLGKVRRNVRFPMFAPDGEFDRSRIDLFTCRVCQISETENAVFHRVPASKPESAGLAVSGNGFGAFKLPVHGRTIALGNLERPHVAELFALGGFAENRRLEIRVFQGFPHRIPDFARLSENREFPLRNVALFSRFPPSEAEFRSVGTIHDAR